MVAERPRVASGQLGAGRPPRGRLARASGAVRPRGAQPMSELPAALIAAHQGRIEDARDRSERALALAEEHGLRIGQSGHRWVLGFIELARRCSDSARAPRTRVGDPRQRSRARAGPSARPGGHVGGADRGRRARGGRAEARTVGEARPGARPLVGAGDHGPRALLLAARGDLAGAQAGFERALAEHARTQDPFQHARTLLAQGSRSGERSSAAPPAWRSSRRSPSSSGSAPRSGPRRRGASARIGGRAPARGELTEAERRIARSSPRAAPTARSPRPLRHRAHRRGRADARLPEARRPLPHRARAPARARD